MSIKKLAMRLDQFFWKYDQHGYDDAGCTPDMALEILEEDPLIVVDNLLEILEDMIQDKT